MTLQNILIIILIISNAGAWIYAFATKINDIKHINKNIDDIWEAIKSIRTEQTKQGKCIERVKGRMDGKE